MTVCSSTSRLGSVNISFRVVYQWSHIILFDKIKLLGLSVYRITMSLNINDVLQEETRYFLLLIIQCRMIWQLGLYLRWYVFDYLLIVSDLRTVLKNSEWNIIIWYCVLLVICSPDPQQSFTFLVYQMKYIVLYEYKIHFRV